MTCREFSDVADSLTLREVLLASSEPIVLHARECPTCEAWLQEQRLLAAAMQSVSTATADCEASPAVEHALLQAFRRQRPAPAPPAQVLAFPPAMRLSRWFETGAYAAVAAAFLIALFLGYNVWRHPAELPTRVQDSSAMALPVSGNSSDSGETPAAQTATTAQSATHRETRSTSNSAKAIPVSAGTALTEEALAKAGYTDLMLCDPLSCSSDAQVVRMELPAQGSSEQTVLADVVVGDDGLVRAIRIVN